MSTEKTINLAQVTYTEPEAWSLTVALRWYNGKLEQCWASNLGRTRWENVPEVTDQEPPR